MQWLQFGSVVRRHVYKMERKMPCKLCAILP